MIKIKVKEAFSDIKNNHKVRKVGEVYEASEERANQLIAKGKVEIYKEPKKAKAENKEQ